MSLRKRFQPALFQGNLNQKNYFEGWYFKSVSADLSNVVSIIPGIAISKDDTHAFIQYYNALMGETHYFRFDINEFKWDEHSFKIEIGENKFSESKMKLKLKNDNVEIEGNIIYSNIVPFQSPGLFSGVMGWYSLVPKMECNHGVVTMNCETDGYFKVNNKIQDFSAGKAYIEKDWGISFPETWIWAQCNNFSDNNTSLMLSVAKIPWMGHFFMGFICVLLINGKFHLFASYNRSKIVRFEKTAKGAFVELKRQKVSLKIEIVQNTVRNLRAPRIGVMERSIKESIDSTIMVDLKNNKTGETYNDKGHRAGVEIIPSIFDYFKLQ